MNKMLDQKVFSDNSFFYPIKDSTYLGYKSLEKGDREKLKGCKVNNQFDYC